MRYGAYDQEVIDRLRWMERELAPAMKAAVLEAEGVDIKIIMAKALHMGDECHNRNVAATATLIRTLGASPGQGRQASRDVGAGRGLYRRKRSFFLESWDAGL